MILSVLPLIVPLRPLNAIISTSGMATAGEMYSLNCTVNKTINGLLNSPTASWTIGGIAINEDSRVAIVTIPGDVVYTSILTLQPLRTSDASGSYSCGGRLTSPARTDPLTVSMSQSVVVKSVSKYFM